MLFKPTKTSLPIGGFLIGLLYIVWGLIFSAIND
jgi:hypothetical protein